MLFTAEGHIILGRLNELLKTYYMATGISIMAIDKTGNLLLNYGNNLDFCSSLNRTATAPCNCQDTHLQACKYTIHIGEPYFCFCPRGFIHIAVPLVHQEQFLGGLLVGPLIVKTAGTTFDGEQFLKNHCSLEDPQKFADLVDKIRQIPVIDPIRTNYLGNILLMMATQEMENYQQYMDKLKEKMEQQSKISEQIQLYKNIANSKTNFHDLEMQLSAKVKSGNLKEAKEILEKWQALIFYAESDMEVLKVRAIELCSMLSRAAIEGGADPKNSLACNYSFLEPLNNLTKIEDISYWLNNILEYYASSVLNLPTVSNMDTIRHAIQYMNTNFAEPITVRDVAEHVHMNHTYFSSIFKKSTKKSFADYLQQIRIEESKLLLSTTDQSILTIAIACGFSSQSYFSKVFLKNTGFTPKQYRTQNASSPLFRELD